MDKERNERLMKRLLFVVMCVIVLLGCCCPSDTTTKTKPINKEDFKTICLDGVEYYYFEARVNPNTLPHGFMSVKYSSKSPYYPSKCDE